MSDDPSTLLEESIEAWEHARRGVLGEARVVPDEGYAFRPHPRSRDVTGLLLHIVESGLMMVGELTRADGDFTRQSPEVLMEEHAGHLPKDPSPAELRDLLESTLEEGEARLREAGEVRMLQTIRRFDGAFWTRLAWMDHGIAHEEYHRGQLALYVRMQGLVPALTQLIHGDSAR
jgi:uncharacterized damage-inducible protein DinB